MRIKFSIYFQSDFKRKPTFKAHAQNKIPHRVKCLETLGTPYSSVPSAVKLGHPAAKKKMQDFDNTEKLGCTAGASAVLTTEPVLLLKIRRALNPGHSLLKEMCFYDRKW